jgi:hypothetical protein
MYHLVDHAYFGGFILTVILLNTVLITLQTIRETEMAGGAASVLLPCRLSRCRKYSALVTLIC